MRQQIPTQSSFRASYLPVGLVDHLLQQLWVARPFLCGRARGAKVRRALELRFAAHATLKRALPVADLYRYLTELWRRYLLVNGEPFGRAVHLRST